MKRSARFSKTAFETAFSSVGAKAGAKLGNNTWYATMESMTENFEDLFPYFIDAVFAPEVESDAFSEIQRQSLKSIRSREDNWRLYTSQEFLKWFFPNHPYGFSKQGDESVVSEVSLEQFRAYQSSLVSPKNTVLSVVGDVNIEDIEADITKILRRYKSSTENNWKELAIPKHHKSQVKESFIKQDIAVVMMAFDGVSLDQYEQLVAVDVLDTVLSGVSIPRTITSSTSRDKGLVYEVHAYHVPLIDSGYFMIEQLPLAIRKTR